MIPAISLSGEWRVESGKLGEKNNSPLSTLHSPLYKNSSLLIPHYVKQLGQQVKMPAEGRNYIEFNNDLVAKIVACREVALPQVEEFLRNAKTEQEICEGLYVLDRMIDARVGGVEKTYPTISRFNNTDSPNIQVVLAGIYRKTQVPDGFGPLINMMIKNAIKPQPQTQAPFDPSEEIGGALLDYIRNNAAKKLYTP